VSSNSVPPPKTRSARFFQSEVAWGPRKGPLALCGVGGSEFEPRRRFVSCQHRGRTHRRRGRFPELGTSTEKTRSVFFKWEVARKLRPSFHFSHSKKRGRPLRASPLAVSVCFSPQGPVQKGHDLRPGAAAVR